ncbi:MAG: SPFH domain-containing protein [Bacteroidetes bacterium]|nr:SPFH domain-containing protein [Bacteroidota bacterium]
MENYFIFIPIILSVLSLLAACFFTVKQKTAVVIERLGKFSRVARAGISFKLPLIDSKAGTINLRVQELPVDVETKTKDDVFVKVVVSIQYYVVESSEGIKSAFYKLNNPTHQIQSYVFDSVRSEVPSMELDEVFSEKEKIASAVQRELSNTMREFGFEIIKTLITDIDPDTKVKISMNEINAAKRMKEATKEMAEAEKIKVIAAAEADAEGKRLQGEGIANQRISIANGMKQSVQKVKGAMEADVSGQQIMNMLFLTQHYDTISKLSENGVNTIFMPYSPGTVGDLQTQIQSSLLAVDQIKSNKNKNLL